MTDLITNIAIVTNLACLLQRLRHFSAAVVSLSWLSHSSSGVPQPLMRLHSSVVSSSDIIESAGSNEPILGQEFGKGYHFRQTRADLKIECSFLAFSRGPRGAPFAHT